MFWERVSCSLGWPSSNLLCIEDDPDSVILLPPPHEWWGDSKHAPPQHVTWFWALNSRSVLLSKFIPSPSYYPLSLFFKFIFIFLKRFVFVLHTLCLPHVSVHLVSSEARRGVVFPGPAAPAVSPYVGAGNWTTQSSPWASKSLKMQECI